MTSLFSEFATAMAAHNQRKPVSANDIVNERDRNGTQRARAVCQAIAVATHGDPKGYITRKDARTWADGMLPAGRGYKTQDITEANLPFIELIQGRFK